MAHWPSGTVTFLFTDIEGSTVLWEQDRAAMREAVARQLTILQSLIDAHHGVLSKTIGDGTQAAFASAEDALRAATAVQRALLAEAWADPPGPLRVRMALHAGEAEPDASGDYLAAPLNRLARLLAIGHGGQILLTQAVQQLTRGALPAQVTLRDLGEHRLRDLVEPERVFQLLHPALPEDFPPLQSLEARPSNLPRQPTPFLGREREVGEIAALLRRPDVQLLTLTGAGGTGKTRLALQVAAEVVDAFADGVVFVALAALADPAQIPSAVATALGVRDEGGQPLAERLAAWLARKQLLLLIDNWEHLLEAAPVLSELLRAAPGLTVLATSRAPLHLQAEREYPVPPLALPRRKPPPTLEQLSQYEAVRLFIARAQAVKPDFTIDNANAPAVAEICHRLDGLPLAIELAAARTRLLPPQAMLTRLEQRLPLLTGGARDAPARQQTLRQTIAWSYDLLLPEEQTLFRRLAVFSGGFSFEAAEAVANPEGATDVLAGVSALVDHSLVQQADGAEGEPRFTMLQTIREFGLERLAESGEEPSVRQVHADWFTALAEHASAAVESELAPEWLTRFVADQDNVRAALLWLERDGDTAGSVRLSGAAAYCWHLRGDRREALDWLEGALAATDQHDVALAPHMRARYWASMLARNQGDYPRATQHAQALLRFAEVAGDQVEAAKAFHLLGYIALGDGAYEQAAAHADDALALLQIVAHPWEQSFVLYDLGMAKLGAGDIDRATSALEAALAMKEALGDRFGTALAFSGLGLVACVAGDQGGAALRFASALPLWRQAGNRENLTEWLACVVCLAAASGAHQRAAQLIGAVHRQCEELGHRLGLPDRQLFDEAERTVQARLGGEVFTAARDAGGGQSLAGALEDAEAFLANPSARESETIAAMAPHRPI